MRPTPEPRRQANDGATHRRSDTATQPHSQSRYLTGIRFHVPMTGALWVAAAALAIISVQAAFKLASGRSGRELPRRQKAALATIPVFAIAAAVAIVLFVRPLYS